MAYNVRDRSFVKEIDLEPRELRFHLQLSGALKPAKYAGNEAKRLEGRQMAAFDQGAHVTYVDPTGSQLGHKESIADTGRVLGRMYNAIDEIRVLIRHARRTSMVKLPSWLPRARLRKVHRCQAVRLCLRSR